MIRYFRTRIAGCDATTRAVESLGDWVWRLRGRRTCRDGRLDGRGLGLIGTDR